MNNELKTQEMLQTSGEIADVDCSLPLLPAHSSVERKFKWWWEGGGGKQFSNKKGLSRMVYLKGRNECMLNQ